MLYRRHVKACEAGKKNRAFSRCKCPVWVHKVIRGVEVRCSLKTTNLKFAGDIIEAWERGDDPTAAPPGILDAMNLYMDELAATNVSVATRKKYRQLFDRLSDWTEARAMHSLTQLNVQAVRDFRASWGVAAVSANKMTERLRAFLRFCEAAEWIAKNPAAALRPAVENQAPTMPFTPQQISSILEAAERHCNDKRGIPQFWARRERALVLVLRWSALRMSDAVMLRTEQVQGDTIALYQHKTGVYVRVPVPQEVIAALNEIGAPEGYYFGCRGGSAATRAGDWRRRLRKLFTEAEVPDGHAHRFRDTRAVELLADGIPMDRVAAILGNTIKVCERHYAPWVKQRQEQLEADVRGSIERSRGRVDGTQSVSTTEPIASEVINAGL